MTAFESRIVNLLGLMLVHERPQVDQIDLLGRAGFRPSEIAVLLGTTRNTVSVRLSQQKRAQNGKRRRRDK
jgi:hypothetical protein